MPAFNSTGQYHGADYYYDSESYQAATTNVEVCAAGDKGRNERGSVNKVSYCWKDYGTMWI